YVWLVNASGLAGFITWMGIAWSHYCFRRAYKAQGKSVKDLPYKASFYPAGPIIALIMCAVVIVGQSLDVISGEASVMDFLAVYIGLLFFLALWGGHKLVTRAPAVKPEEADLSRHI
ncbi:MAG: gamma-aminobutyrate permease, partial [Varibaculum cambriense]|nr:gamma-aminobutyrate permease [Varibaculum cambriense]